MLLRAQRAIGAAIRIDTFSLQIKLLKLYRVCMRVHSIRLLANALLVRKDKIMKSDYPQFLNVCSAKFMSVSLTK